jgi:hypothetical protein
MNKIVVGKPATTADANPASYMTPATLNASFVAAYQYNQWKTGVMFWQFSSDPNGTILQQSMSGLLTAMGGSNSTNSNTTNSTSNSTTNTTNSTSLISYPIRFTCVNTIISTSSDQNIIKSLAVPVSSSVPGYNYVSLYTWTYSSASQDILLIWSNPRSYFTNKFCGSNSNALLRTNLKANYSKNGVKLLAHVFGSS